MKVVFKKHGFYNEKVVFRKPGRWIQLIDSELNSLRQVRMRIYIYIWAGWLGWLAGWLGWLAECLGRDDVKAY